MARVQVIADDGWVALDELAAPQQLDSDHYRHCLGDRIKWAVDACNARTQARVHAGERPPLRVVERPSRRAA
jgi:hypothetical protein